MLGASAFAADKPTMGVVVKIGGIPWFNAMETGIKEEGAKDGVDAFMVGPTSADPALQVRAIEDLIAKKVNVIGVVPNDEKALEPVLQKARDAGIKVITHECPGIQNKDWDFELASAKGFGEAHAKLLAKTMGGKGEYAVFVGSLTVPLHNAWADAAIAYLKANYPDMKLVGDRYGVAENVDDSRKTALDLISAHPDLKGFLAFGSQGPIGAGRAVEEKGDIGKVFVVGPLLAGAGTQAHQGRRSRWAASCGIRPKPATCSSASARWSPTARRSRTATTIEGLGVVHPDPKTKNIITDNLLQINKDTVDKLADLGL